MSEYDKSWIKWAALGMILGYAAGKVISVVLSTVFNNNSETFTLLVSSLPPVGVIAGLSIVLYVYSIKKLK